MDIKQQKNGNIGSLILNGRFDFNSHRTFKESYSSFLSDAEVKTVEIDLASVSYIDSSALGMLLMLRERSDGMGKKVVLRNPNEIVVQILDIANFNKLFPIVKS